MARTNEIKQQKYSTGFEKFWSVWLRLTGVPNDKNVAAKYWKRDKLEKHTEEMIARLIAYDQMMAGFERREGWRPRWSFCRKFLNEKRYTDVKLNEETKKPTPMISDKKLIELKKKATSLVKSIPYKTRPLTRKEFEARRQKQLADLRQK